MKNEVRKTIMEAFQRIECFMLEFKETGHAGYKTMIKDELVLIKQLREY
jgi:hypothetical protein